MGQTNSAVCREMLAQANYDYWIYLALTISVLFFIFFLLPFFLIIAFLTRHVQFLGILSELLLRTVQWFDLNAAQYPTAIQLGENETDAKVLQSDDLIALTEEEQQEQVTAQKTDSNVDYSQYLSKSQSRVKKASSRNMLDREESRKLILDQSSTNKRKKKKKPVFLNLKDSARTVGGYFTLMLFTASVIAIFFTCYTYTSPLASNIIVTPTPLSAVKTLSPISTSDNVVDAMIEVAAQFDCNVLNGLTCDYFSAKVRARESNSLSYPLREYTCVEDDNHCKLNGFFNATISNNAYTIYNDPYVVEITGYGTFSVPYAIPIKIKSWVNTQYRTYPTFDEVYYFADSCRNTLVASNSFNYDVNFYGNMRRKCEKLFGNMQTCSSTALGFTSDSIYPSTSSGGIGTLRLNFYLSPTMLDTNIQDPSATFIFVVVLVFLILVLGLQPILKKFAAKTVANFIKRRLTGKGIGVIKAFLTGIFISVYFAVSGVILFLFITAVLLDYQIKLPAYVFDTDVIAQIIAANVTVAIVIAVGWLLLSLFFICLSIFYLGMDSLKMKKQIQNNDTIVYIKKSFRVASQPQF